MSCWVMTKTAAGVFVTVTGDLETEVTSMLPSCSRLRPRRLFWRSAPACWAAQENAQNKGKNALRDKTTRLRGSGRSVILSEYIEMGSETAEEHAQRRAVSVLQLCTERLMTSLVSCSEAARWARATNSASEAKRSPIN